VSRANESMNTPNAAQPGSSAAPSCSAGHLIDYVNRLHIITGPDGQCMCGEGGITCSERLRQVSHEIGAALCAASLLPRRFPGEIGSELCRECHSFLIGSEKGICMGCADVPSGPLNSLVSEGIADNSQSVHRLDSEVLARP
jgi:hypothetical protein